MTIKLGRRSEIELPRQRYEHVSIIHDEVHRKPTGEVINRAAAA